MSAVSIQSAKDRYAIIMSQGVISDFAIIPGHGYSYKVNGVPKSGRMQEVVNGDQDYISTLTSLFSYHGATANTAMGGGSSGSTTKAMSVGMSMDNSTIIWIVVIGVLFIFRKKIPILNRMF